MRNIFLPTETAAAPATGTGTGGIWYHCPVEGFSRWQLSVILHRLESRNLSVSGAVLLLLLLLSDKVELSISTNPPQITRNLPARTAECSFLGSGISRGVRHDPNSLTLSMLLTPAPLAFVPPTKNADPVNGIPQIISTLLCFLQMNLTCRRDLPCCWL